MHRKMNAKCICKRAVIIIKAEQKSMLRSSSWWMKTKKNSGMGMVMSLIYISSFAFISIHVRYGWIFHSFYILGCPIPLLLMLLLPLSAGKYEFSYWIFLCVNQALEIPVFEFMHLHCISTKMLMINTIKCVKISKPYTSTQVPMLFECSMSVDEDFSNVKMWQRNTISLDFCSE